MKFGMKTVLGLIVLINLSSLSFSEDNTPENSAEYQKIREDLEQIRQQLSVLSARVDEALKKLPNEAEVKKTLEFCGDITLGNAPVGTECITMTGSKWLRVDDGIMDNTSGVVWELKIKTSVEQPEAEKYCQYRNFELPTGYPLSLNGKNGIPNKDSDYLTADKHGIREVFKENDWFWSATSSPIQRNLLYTYNYSGQGFDGNLKHFGSKGSARCIIRR